MGHKNDEDKSSMKSYMDQLDKLIDKKKKENQSIKTIVDAMTKNQKEKKD